MGSQTIQGKLWGQRPKYCGFEKVYETTLQAIQPYIQPNGHVVYNNKFRVVVSEK